MKDLDFFEFKDNDAIPLKNTQLVKYKNILQQMLLNNLIIIKILKKLLNSAIYHLEKKNIILR